MAKVQFITAPDGSEMAVLPRADFERLAARAEDAADIAAIERFRHRLAAGDEEVVPFAVAERLLDGENPVRVWREHRGLSSAALAEAAGLSQPYLSQIETGNRDGTLRVMATIAHALHIDIDDLVTSPEA